MDSIIVYVDDAAYARQLLQPMQVAGGLTQWILVACAPQLTRRASKWVSHSARLNWRNHWADKVFASLVPILKESGDKVHTVLAEGKLCALTDALHRTHGPARVMDARRPKFGHDLQALTTEQPEPEQHRWQVPGAIVGMGAMLVLAAE